MKSQTNPSAFQNHFPHLVLASQSERRSHILRQIGLNFQQDFDLVDEQALPGENPHDFTLRLAESKAKIVRRRHPRSILIGADTIVRVEDRVLGKPSNRQEAKEMLYLLSGRRHQVITGLCLLETETDRCIARNAITDVLFAELSPHEIEAYIGTGEPEDKAGSYGIQEKGALWVREIHGCYYNIVGFPVRLFYELWQEFLPRQPLLSYCSWVIPSPAPKESKR